MRSTIRKGSPTNQLPVWADGFVYPTTEDRKGHSPKASKSADFVQQPTVRIIQNSMYDHVCRLALQKKYRARRKTRQENVQKLGTHCFLSLWASLCWHRGVELACARGVKTPPASSRFLNHPGPDPKDLPNPRQPVELGGSWQRPERVPCGDCAGHGRGTGRRLLFLVLEVWRGLITSKSCEITQKLSNNESSWTTMKSNSISIQQWETSWLHALDPQKPVAEWMSGWRKSQTGPGVNMSLDVHLVTRNGLQHHSNLTWRLVGCWRPDFHSDKTPEI